jgi:predicted PurR-regulated permease PerM
MIVAAVSGASVNSTRWRIALWLLMLATVVWLGWVARSALIPFAIGAMVAYALSPLVDRLVGLPIAANVNPDVRRGVAVGVIYVVFGGLLIWVSSVALVAAAHQIIEFVNTFPETVAAAQRTGTAWLERYRAQVPAELQAQIEGYVQDASAALTAGAALMARNTLNALTSTIGLILGFAVIPFFVFYAMRDKGLARVSMIGAAPSVAKPDVDNVLRIADRMLGRFLQGQLILGLLVGLAATTGLALLDVQLSLGLGLIAGITELVPVIGPWLGAIPGLLVVLATEPDKFVWVAGLYLGIQLVENNLLVPRIQGGAVEIHPAMVLLLLVAFGAAMGFWGLVVAVPLTAILRELFWYADARLRGVRADDAFARTRVGLLQAHSEPAPLDPPKLPATVRSEGDGGR